MPPSSPFHTREKTRFEDLVTCPDSLSWPVAEPGRDQDLLPFGLFGRCCHGFGLIISPGPKSTPGGCSPALLFSLDAGWPQYFFKLGINCRCLNVRKFSTTSGFSLTIQTDSSGPASLHGSKHWACASQLAAVPRAASSRICDY